MSKHKGFPRERIITARKVLVEQFPDTFKGFKVDKPPLKIGIYYDIKAVIPELSGRALRETLADYTSGPSYLGHVKEGAMRLGLDGKPAGEVTAIQEKFAKGRHETVLNARGRNQAPTIVEAVGAVPEIA